jgi:flagellar M-ring protein FliF
MGQVGDKAKTVLAGFTLGQKAVVAVALLGLLLGAVALSKWAAQPQYSQLFTNLAPADASAIVDQLKTDGVTYQLTNGGTTIMVPQEQVYDVRISLAGKGLTNSSDTSGYGILDQQGVTATDFQQNVAYQRAVEGELAKTLGAINGVNTAIVHLAIPKKDVFTTEEDKPTASVLLSLAPGTTLGRVQIRSVMHLVAGSVAGMDPSDVTVTDADGNMLSVREDGQSGAAGAASEADQLTQQFEDTKSAAIQQMLDKVLGKGKAVVRVNAELNFDSSETTSETYMTQTGIPPLAEATSSESYAASNAAVGGALGVTYPSLTPGVGGNGGGTYVKVEKTVNNAVGKAVSKTTAAPGGIKRLTVAVVVDSKAQPQIDTAGVQDLVSQAAGLVTAAPRLDTIQVTPMAFDTTAAATAKAELAQAQKAAQTAQYVGLGKKAGLGLLVVLAAFFLLRRRKKDASADVQAVATDLPQPAQPAALLPAAEEPLAISGPSEAWEVERSDAMDKSLERELLRDEVAKFVDQQPEEIAQIVQGWLGQRKG